MCVDPGTVLAIASVASAGVSAVASIQNGRAQYQAEMVNSEVARQNAQATEDEKQNVQDAAAIDRRRRGEQALAEKGALIANFANQGLDTQFGTPADLVGDTQRAYMIDRSILGRNEITQLKTLDKQQADFLTQANQSRASANGALKGGYLGALGSVLGGAAQISDKWIQPPSPKALAGSKLPIPAKHPMVAIGGG